MASGDQSRVLYDGRYEVTYEDGPHLYTVHDRNTGRSFIPGSITGVLGVIHKPALVPWAAKLAAETGNPKESDKVRDAAARRGSAVHDAIEAYLRDPDMSEADLLKHAGEDAIDCCRQFLRWVREYEVDLESVESEVLVYSESLQVAGTLDLVGWSDRLMAEVVVDYKTSSRVYATHVVQVGFYLSALREEGRSTAQERGVLHLRDKGFTYYDEGKCREKGGTIEQTQRVVQACADIYRWQRAGKGRQ